MLNETLIVVLSCDRQDHEGQPVDYLPGTLAELDEAGAVSSPHRWIYHDGPVRHREPPLSPPGWKFHGDAEGRTIGSKRMLWKAIRKAAAEFERLLFFEDDVRPCPGAVTRMLAQEIPKEAAFVSFFDLGAIFHAAGLTQLPLGLYQLPIENFSSNCALLFPKRSLKWLAERQPPELPWCTANSSDTALNDIFRANRGSPWNVYGLHVPSLVQHVGDVSSIYNRTHEGRRAPSFMKDFDALNFPAFRSWKGLVVKD